MGIHWRVIGPPLLLTAAAAAAGLIRGIAADELVLGLPAIFLLLAGAVALANPEIVRAARTWSGNSPLRILALAQILLLPYLLYTGLLHRFSLGGFLRILLYVNLPVLISLRSSPGSIPGWRDGVAVLLIWLPLDFRVLDPVWSWPAGQSGYYLYAPMGVCLAALVFVVIRRLEAVGYTFSIRGRDLGAGALCFLVFAPVAISIGLGTGFLSPARELPPVLPSLGKVVGIFLLTGVPEELLFRGLIQNLLQRWISQRWLSLLVSAAIFGAAHLNNGPSPDWRYFLLATLAGVAYGTAYRRGITLMAPALTHTLVDSVWALFFRG